MIRALVLLQSYKLAFPSFKYKLDVKMLIAVILNMLEGRYTNLKSFVSFEILSCSRNAKNVLKYLR